MANGAAAAVARLHIVIIHSTATASAAATATGCGCGGSREGPLVLLAAAAITGAIVMLTVAAFRRGLRAPPAASTLPANPARSGSRPGPRLPPAVSTLPRPTIPARLIHGSASGSGIIGSSGGSGSGSGPRYSRCRLITGSRLLGPPDATAAAAARSCVVDPGRNRRRRADHEGAQVLEGARGQWRHGREGDLRLPRLGQVQGRRAARREVACCLLRCLHTALPPVTPRPLLGIVPFAPHVNLHPGLALFISVVPPALVATPVGLASSLAGDAIPAPLAPFDPSIVPSVPAATLISAAFVVVAAAVVAPLTPAARL